MGEVDAPYLPLPLLWRCFPLPVWLVRVRLRLRFRRVVRIRRHGEILRLTSSTPGSKKHESQDVSRLCMTQR